MVQVRTLATMRGPGRLLWRMTHLHTLSLCCPTSLLASWTTIPESPTPRGQLCGTCWKPISTQLARTFSGYVHLLFFVNSSHMYVNSLVPCRLHALLLHANPDHVRSSKCSILHIRCMHGLYLLVSQGHMAEWTGAGRHEGVDGQACFRHGQHRRRHDCTAGWL